jgi:ribose-phosphate pyrophosphokinase
MDLHSPQIQGFFRIPVDHLLGRAVNCQRIQSLNISDLVICSPDVGFAKDAVEFGKILDCPTVIGSKIRTDHTETVSVHEIIGNVAGRNVVLVDDFTITGRTLITMAEALKERGAKDIYAAVTHGVLSEGAAQRIGESCIRKMFMTDTIESFEEVLPENIEIVPVAPLFAQFTNAPASANCSTSRVRLDAPSSRLCVETHPTATRRLPFQFDLQNRAAG